LVKIRAFLYNDVHRKKVFIRNTAILDLKKKNCNFDFKETLTITVYSSDIQNPAGCVYCTWAWVGDSFLGPAVRLGFI